jgi:GNAT superfamily N-acetyltransferase
MKYRLEEIAARRYAAQVLPLTEPLWGHGRTLELYQAQTTALARTPYGRASYRTVALCEGTEILATFKRYERDARAGNEALRSIGIGAVFTPDAFRGQGFASAMLAMALDHARSAGIDFAFLFSDIRPQFYKDLGFIELPSRVLSFRADSLEPRRVAVQPVTHRDWSGLRTCFDAMERLRPFAFLRSPALWGWLRARMAHQAAEQPRAQLVNLSIRRGRSIDAYVLGRREPRYDAFVVDEIGVRDSAATSLIAPLLRCAAGDLRRITGWLPPAPVRGALPRGSVRKRSDAIFMIAPLSEGGRRFLNLALASGSADAVGSLDHI